MSALCWIFHTMSLWNLFFSSQHPYCSFVMTALKTKACKQDSAVMNIFPMFVLQPLCTRDLYTSFIKTWIFVSCERKISSPVWAESTQKQKVASQTEQWLIYFQYLFCNCFAQGVIFSKPDLYITFIITWILYLVSRKYPTLSELPPRSV